ncbi:MAG TPA: AAA family ATPase [Gaiellaceae bacterium]
MAAEGTTTVMLRSSEESVALAGQLRRLARVATIVALLTSPATYFFFRHSDHLSVPKSVLFTALVVVGFRGLVDLLIRRLVPWPSLFGTEDARLREEDVVNRRRSWTWRFIYRLAIFIGALFTIIFLYRYFSAAPGSHVTWWGSASQITSKVSKLAHSSAFWIQMVFVVFLFLANFLIFMGPMMLMGISQIRGYEPGDAEWGVKLEDVRGQAEAKEEVRRVVTLWQSGEAFERAGGKRERGLLFLGAPGTGKTMLAKAIATGFNSPFVSIPGSGFAQTFIGIDALIVRFLARKAKKLARKWGGQCIVFIDEIDAVGMRRQALGNSRTFDEEVFLQGPNGALSASGDVVIENRAWREHIFEQRAPERHSPYPGWMHKASNLANQGIFPGMMGGGMGQLALNQLLVVMDGIDNPPFMRRFLTNRINSLLDAIYVVPRRIGRVSLRLRAPRPLNAQIYFIGATNVPIERLDPALTRPGRMGRHVWFRTPTKDDRVDVFDLYLGKVAHDPELDTPEARDEIGRMTNGYSPAMIDQVCSMALTHAQHDGRVSFSRRDLVEAMTTIESGTAIGVESVPDELRATAIHEAGHALASHVYQKNLEATRLSVRMRGGSLGHFYGIQQEERFARWRSDDMATLTMLLGAMAAEHVFYGENSNGVGGDVQSTTALASYMVGASAMAPEPITVTRTFDDETEEETRERIMKRFEKIGVQIMNRTGGGSMFDADPIRGVLGDRDKRAMAAQIIGQAYIRAYHLMAENKQAVEKIATELVERREMYGNEVVDLLKSLPVRTPEIDLTADETWPRI